MPAPTLKMTMSRSDWILLGVLSLLWGGSFFFVQLAVGHLQPFTIVYLRVTLAAAALGIVLMVTGTAFPKGAAAWRALFVMGLMNNALPFSFFVLAQGEIGSALAAILNATTPLFTLVVAHFATTDERMTPARTLGLLVGFGGVLVMMNGAALHSGGVTVAAQIACLAAALCYALASVWGRRFKGLGVPPLATAFGMLCTSSLILLPLVLLHDRPWQGPLPGAVPLAAILGLAVLSTALAYLIYFRLLARAGAVNLALVTFLIPVSAIALAILVLGETLASRHIAGMALIAAGLAVIDGRVLRRR
ncbi:DMT family transporter [Pseudorhodobacter sp.]|uniref:DMT family transporter n=1 Tax=Pseudorhodobacter sp. TaxID=1934400 RepID=UPI002647C000|nr:DMT family transporter [Pseudorhodobacter sp.]MDN5785887.1 DMT family transporter [Pseudorhodobacter sp.]